MHTDRLLGMSLTICKSRIYILDLLGKGTTYILGGFLQSSKVGKSTDVMV